MILRAEEEDLSEIVSLQRQAFKEEAEYVRDTSIKPMIQTIEDVRKEYSEGIILKYVEDGRIVGSIRAKVEGDTCHISRVVVLPGHWSKGIGTALMMEVERIFPDVRVFELFTRIDHTRTRPFYAKLGYLPYKTEKVSDTLTFVYLKKARE